MKSKTSVCFIYGNLWRSEVLSEFESQFQVSNLIEL